MAVYDSGSGIIAFRFQETIFSITGDAIFGISFYFREMEGFPVIEAVKVLLEKCSWLLGKRWGGYNYGAEN
jgi:hypothetical protein